MWKLTVFLSIIMKDNRIIKIRISCFLLIKYLFTYLFFCCENFIWKNTDLKIAKHNLVWKFKTLELVKITLALPVLFKLIVYQLLGLKPMGKHVDLISAVWMVMSKRQLKTNLLHLHIVGFLVCVVCCTFKYFLVRVYWNKISSLCI